MGVVSDHRLYPAHPLVTARPAAQLLPPRTIDHLVSKFVTGWLLRRALPDQLEEGDEPSCLDESPELGEGHGGLVQLGDFCASVAGGGVSGFSADLAEVVADVLGGQGGVGVAPGGAGGG